MSDLAANLLESDIVRESYLGQKEAGIRGQRRWRKKRLW
jgi:branched-chain amino acid transport system ATP-binding protein